MKSCNRYGKTNGEANEEEQAEDVQVVAHLVQHFSATQPHYNKKQEIPTMASFNRFD